VGNFGLYRKQDGMKSGPQFPLACCGTEWNYWALTWPPSQARGDKNMSSGGPKEGRFCWSRKKTRNMLGREPTCKGERLSESQACGKGCGSRGSNRKLGYPWPVLKNDSLSMTNIENWVPSVTGAPNVIVSISRGLKNSALNHLNQHTKYIQVHPATFWLVLTVKVHMQRSPLISQ
jgi:hypothetical protein